MSQIVLSEKYVTEIAPKLNESSLKIYNVLLLLRNKNNKKFVEIRDKDLSDLSGLTAVGISYAIKQLERIGLIEAIRSPGKNNSEYIVKTVKEINI